MAKTSKKQKARWYKQCTFNQPTEQGHRVHTAWIPEKLAVVGKKVYFGKKAEKPEPELLWTVSSVSDGRVSEEYLIEHERDYTTQRQASDI